MGKLSAALAVSVVSLFIILGAFTKSPYTVAIVPKVTTPTPPPVTLQLHVAPVWKNGKAKRMLSTDYVVSGSGNALVDGTYTVTGTQNGADYFAHDIGGSTFYYLFWDNINSAWILGASLTDHLGDSTVFYYADAGAGATISHIPTTGWTAFGAGTPPAPTVTGNAVTTNAAAAAVLKRLSDRRRQGGG